MDILKRLLVPLIALCNNLSTQNLAASQETTNLYGEKKVEEKFAFSDYKDQNNLKAAIPKPVKVVLYFLVFCVALYVIRLLYKRSKNHRTKRRTEEEENKPDTEEEEKNKNQTSKPDFNKDNDRSLRNKYKDQPVLFEAKINGVTDDFDYNVYRKQNFGSRFSTGMSFNAVQQFKYESRTIMDTGLMRIYKSLDAPSNFHIIFSDGEKTIEKEWNPLHAVLEERNDQKCNIQLHGVGEDFSSWDSITIFFQKTGNIDKLKQLKNQI